jgi:GNAT superfamily N-acetyltransferase
VTVRPLREADRAAWEPLWAGYLTFYQSVLPSDITEMTWSRFHHEGEQLYGLGAEQGGMLIGFAHYLLHRSTWARHCYCYLEDIFVAETARGAGAGRALIDAVETAACKANASRLYWTTHETNAQARALYDKVAQRSGFIQYRKSL